jgi:hypothetical protein
MLNRLRRAITGPSREEMGMPSVETTELPLIRESVPYKPGTEHAQWATFRPKYEQKGWLKPMNVLFLWSGVLVLAITLAVK